MRQNNTLWDCCSSACVCVCVHLCVYFWNVLTVQHPLRGTRAGKQKGLLVLETIFSYPTRAGEELLHKNTSIRERAGQRGGGEGGGGGEQTGGSMNGGETWTLSIFLSDLSSLSLSLCLSVCLSVCRFLSHLVPDPLSVGAVQIGCSCGEGSYGALTGLLFLPVTHTNTHTYIRAYAKRLCRRGLVFSSASVRLLYLSVDNQLIGRTVTPYFISNRFDGKSERKLWNERVFVFATALRHKPRHHGGYQNQRCSMKLS